MNKALKVMETTKYMRNTRLMQKSVACLSTCTQTQTERQTQMSLLKKYVTASDILSCLLWFMMLLCSDHHTDLQAHHWHLPVLCPGLVPMTVNSSQMWLRTTAAVTPTQTSFTRSANWGSGTPTTRALTCWWTTGCPPGSSVSGLWWSTSPGATS